jgi:hypothetical protein
MKSEKINQIIEHIKSGKPYSFWKGIQNGDYIDDYADYTIRLSETFTITGCYHADKINSDINFSIEKTEPELIEWLNGFDEQFLK